MSVNKYKILTSTLPGGSGGTMTIPFKMDYFPVDNSELVQKEFVEEESLKVINPIIDYEKIKFVPSFSGQSGTLLNPQVPEIKIILNKSNGTPLYYSDIGITNDDIKFSKGRFLKTFVNFSFYDLTLPTRQKVIFNSSYFTQIGFDQRNTTNFLPLDVGSMPVSMRIYDPILYRGNISENYNIYWRKKDVMDSSKELYMRASLNNAVNGLTTQYYCILEPPPTINSPNFYNNLFTKYTLLKDSDGVYKYFIDNSNISTSGSWNVSVTPTLITINLYPLNVL